MSNTAGIKTDYSNIAPRVGFSATLPPQMVVRGGWGLAYFPGNYMSQSFLKSAPFIEHLRSGDQQRRVRRHAEPASSATGCRCRCRPTAANPDRDHLRREQQDFKNTRTQQYQRVHRERIRRQRDRRRLHRDRISRTWRSTSATSISRRLRRAAIQPRRAFASTLPNVSSLPLISSDYLGTYNALQVVFQRRQRAGLTIGSNYTLAHAVVTNAAPWDPNVTERYDSGFDVRHRVVFSANYELPFYRSDSGAAHAVLGGWQVNTVAFYQTGLPYTVTNGTARSNTGGTDRPNQIGDPNLDNPTVAQWFNVAAFAAQPINTVGNTGNSTLHGPPQRRIDLSLFKNFAVTGSARLQLRWEVFNVFNTASFAAPNSAFGTAGFGSITSTGNAIPRQMQFAVKLLF